MNDLSGIVTDKNLGENFEVVVKQPVEKPDFHACLESHVPPGERYLERKPQA